MTAYEYQYTVQQEDIDMLKHVNNVVYVQWVQDAAVKHWTALTKTIDTSGYVWVVVRHEIDYLRQTFLGDELLIKTWVGHTEGSVSIRHVEMYKQDKLVCKAQTNWRFLSAKTFRPTDITRDILNRLTN